MNKKVLIAVVVVMIVASLSLMTACDSGAYVWEDMSIKIKGSKNAVVSLDFEIEGKLVKYEGKATYSIAKKADKQGNRAMTLEWKDKDGKPTELNVSVVMDKNGNIVVGDLYTLVKTK